MRLICGLIFIGVFHYGACQKNPDGNTNSTTTITPTTTITSSLMSTSSLVTTTVAPVTNRTTADAQWSTADTVSTTQKEGKNASIEPTVKIATSVSVVTSTTSKVVSENTVVTKKDITSATHPPSASTPSASLTMAGSVQVLNTAQTETNNMFSTTDQPESTSLNSVPEDTGTTNTPFTSKATSTAHVPTPIGTSTTVVTPSCETIFCKYLQGKFKFSSCNITKETVNGTTTCTGTFQISPDEMETFLETTSLVNPIFQYTTATTPPETTSSTSLLIILASVGALLATLAVIVIYIICHRRSYKMNQQHLTEELHTTENGYHDNPTLEVMEVQPEMQEKKAALRDFNDSWIVPIDNLAKDDLPEEEDTHL